MTITEPVLIEDMAEADYHGHEGSLSASGMKKLLAPSCPAKYKASLGKQEVKKVFDFGHVAHRLVLGKGSEIEVLPFDSMRTNEAKAADKEARAAGRVPILEAEYQRASDLADAVLTDPLAASLFTDGRAEVSAFWPDERTGIIRRARFDWLRDPVEGRRLIFGDLKTALSAEPRAFGKAVDNFGYAIQAAQYADAVVALGLDEDPLCLFVAVEKVEPYVVTVFDLDESWMRIGRAKVREAIDTFVRCTEADHWPDYGQGEVVTLSPPAWLADKYEEPFVHLSEEPKPPTECTHAPRPWCTTKEESA